jgi:hypothetical protein
VSPLSPETLSVHVAPGELAAVLWRGLRPQLADKRRVPVNPLPGTPGGGVVPALAALLREFPTCRRLRLVLAAPFTPLQLLPWRDDLRDRDEALALARLGFTEVYGEAAADWPLRLSDAPPGQARVAAAVDGELLAALEGTARGARMRLLALQPALSAVANHWRGRFDRQSTAWVVVHEPGRLTLALIEHGAWRWLRSLRADADWGERLPEVLEHEALLAGAEALPAHALVFSPTEEVLSQRAGSAWSLRRLLPEARRDFLPASDAPFSLALIG